MKMNGKFEVLAQISRRRLLLAALLVMVLSLTTVSRAQSSLMAVTAQAEEKKAAVTAAETQVPDTPAKLTSLPSKLAVQVHEKSGNNGTHEGITVHGYWNIDIQNPDGKVTTHREFENSLVGTEIAPNLIFGVMTPLGWMVELDGGTGAQSSSPCGTVQCYLFESTPGAIAFVARGSGGQCGAAPNCPTVLTRTPALGTYIPNTSPVVSLQATFPALSAGFVGNVGTTLLGCVSSNLFSTSTPAGLSTTSPADCTAGNIPSTGVDFFRAVFTGTAVSPAIPVASGQTVSVTVKLSFQ